MSRNTMQHAIQGLLAALLIAVMPFAWAQTQTRPPATVPPPPVSTPAAVTPSAAETADKRQIRVQLSPRRYTTLAAEIGAKISSLPVQEGGSFRAGQLLVAFDCSVQTAQLNKAEAALAGAQSLLQANQRLDQLNSVGKVELDMSKADFEKARAEVATMRALLAKCRIGAPFSGRVAEQKVREQQFVQPGQAVLDIIDDSVLEVEFIAPSSWLSRLRPGSSFRVIIDETGKSYPARIQRVGARVDPVSQSIKILAAIEGKYPDLLAGMSGKADFGSEGPR